MPLIAHTDVRFSKTRIALIFVLPNGNSRQYKMTRMSFCTHDKTRKVVYNVNAYKSEQDKKIHALLEYVKTKTPTDTFTIKLDNMVEEIKLSSKFRREYMIQNLALSDARRMGRNEMALSTAKNLLSFGVNTLEQISQATGLALETVQKLAAEYANSKPQLATEIKF